MSAAANPSPRPTARTTLASHEFDPIFSDMAFGRRPFFQRISVLNEIKTLRVARLGQAARLRG